MCDRARPPAQRLPFPHRACCAGGASQCAFSKRSLAGLESAFVLVLQLPLRGVLKSGGLVFVLKGEASKTDRCGGKGGGMGALGRGVGSRQVPGGRKAGVLDRQAKEGQEQGGAFWHCGFSVPWEVVDPSGIISEDG